MRPSARVLLLVGAAVVLPGLIAERALGWLGADWGLVASTLYFNEADLPLLGPSADPFLRYEPCPGSRCEATVAGRRYAARINGQGARGAELSLVRPDGAVRILFLGASSVFGAGVHDHESLPARLEALLTAALGRPVEVWNLGVDGYAPSQVLRRARRELARIPQVDLLLISVPGLTRRPFLAPSAHDEDGASLLPCATVDNRAIFEQDPSSWTENFPDPPLSGLLGERRALALHGWALRVSPGYRYLAALGVDWAQKRPPQAAIADLASSEARALEAEALALGVPLAWVVTPELRGAPLAGSGAVVLELYRPDRDPAYYEVHPPAEQLAARAELLGALLLERGLVPGGTAVGAGPAVGQNSE